MTDNFLINFALSTLVCIAFAFQHISQVIFKQIISDWKSDVGNDHPEKRIGKGFGIFILQLLSIAIIIEIFRYSFSK